MTIDGLGNSGEYAHLENGDAAVQSNGSEVVSELTGRHLNQMGPEGNENGTLEEVRKECNRVLDQISKAGKEAQHQLEERYLSLIRAAQM